MKFCPKCDKLKEYKFFCRSARSGDGFAVWCKDCEKAKQRTYFTKNKELIYAKKRAKEEQDKIKAKEDRRRYITTWLAKNPEYRREYYQENKELILQRSANYSKKRRQEDVLFVLKIGMKRRVIEAISSQGYTKRSRSYEILGCDAKALKEYIEKQFQPGMNWVDRSLWHLDHKIPLASAKSEEELLKLCHYTNLQPLWAADNQFKGDKILSIVRHTAPALALA